MTSLQVVQLPERPACSRAKVHRRLAIRAIEKNEAHDRRVSLRGGRHNINIYKLYYKYNQ